ncbi:helix-turn-helix domain-containing protein [Micrococcus lylae]|uniref:AraC-like ligand-binding domain-containing protein n=1 Tax=Micrococcus lylae TaxID=1273 RepID=UPI0021A8A3D0|nr:helix-turn-helix domain-containing protein [Micrococcus lylae]MCT2006425.1 helix-turn-helix domain-containing protein [Micrococcus lylae]MCT2071075.1 helix-turn-helix domain-containing protein [Micrococcus lylae]
MRTCATAMDYETWRGIISDSFVPLEAESSPGHAGDASRGRIELSSVGGIGLSTLHASPHTVRRTERLTGAGGGGLFKLSLQLSGRGLLVQDGREVVLEPGRLALYDTSLPYELTFDRDFSSHVMMFPHAALGMDPAQAGQLTATALDADHHLGDAVGDFLRQAAGVVPQLDPTVGARLARNVVDLVGTLVTDILGCSTPEGAAAAVGNRIHDDGASSVCLSAPRGGRGERDRQRDQVVAYIEAHLADPDLAPATIAAAHFMSVRSLHLLFEDTDTTVAALIRSLRLERCREELTDPACATRPVCVVGARWGFTDPAHFSRVFRARFGVTPGQSRRAAA